MTHDLVAGFREAADAFSAKVAIRYQAEGGWAGMTYAELKARVNSARAFLSLQGVKKGDRVAICLENGPHWPAIFFATLAAGAVAVPLSTEYTPSEIENICNDAQARVLFCAASCAQKTKGIKCPSVLKVVSAQEAFGDASGGAPQPAAGGPLIAPDDPACILYTSGTTARPKGVVLTHRNLLSNSASLYKLRLFSSKDSIVSLLPLHHAYPLTVTLILPIIYGCEVVYPASMRAKAVLAAMRDLNPTVFVAVPQIFSLLDKKFREAFRKIPFPLGLLFRAALSGCYRLRSLTGLNPAKTLLFKLHAAFGRRMRLLVSGGAKLDPDVAKDFLKFGFTILEGYGLTETSPVLTLNPAKKPKIGSAGKPIPDVQLRIERADETGAGEVAVSGPNVMTGYYKRKDLTDEVLKDGWFYTGDLGYLDREGYLFLTGRAKDVIVLSSGLNVYPGEVEEAYIKRVPIREMCILDVPAKPGQAASDMLWAVIVPDLEYFRKYGEVNLRSVIQERLDNVSRTLAPHQRLMGFTITLEDLPHTLLGKVKRYEVRKKYLPLIAAQGRPVAEEKASPGPAFGSETAKKIADLLKKEFKVEKEIRPSDLLELDLGIDSLGRIELASGLERALGIKIEDALVGNAFTVADVVAAVEGLLEKGAEPAGPLKEKAGPVSWKGLLAISPEAENLAKLDLTPGFGAWLSAFLFTLATRAVFKLFFRLRPQGAANFPSGGPYILYANHVSYFDAFLVISALKSWTRLDLFFVGFRPYFNVPVIRSLVKVGRIIPLDFSTHFLQALRSAFYVLSNKKNLCLFPEGMRGLDGRIGEFKKGFGILAKETGSRLIPVLIEGAYEAWPRTRPLPRPHPIKVTFGEPFSVEEAEAIGRKQGAKDAYEAVSLGARKVLLDMQDKARA